MPFELPAWICLNCGEINLYTKKPIPKGLEFDASNVSSYHCQNCLANRKMRVGTCD